MQTNNQYWIESLMLDNNTWNYLTECKQMGSGSFKNKVIYKLFTDIYIYIYNNPQGLICHKTQSNNHYRIQTTQGTIYILFSFTEYEGCVPWTCYQNDISWILQEI